MMVDPIISEYVKEQGVQAAETRDVLVRDEIHGGSNVIYPTGRTARNQIVAVTDKPTIDQYRKAALLLQKNKVKKVAGRYVTFISPDQKFDLLDDPKFLKAYEIGMNNTPLIEGEVADVYGIKFIEVDNPKIFTGAGAASANVHSSVMIGDEAYGITKIDGNGDVQTILKPLGSSGSADALNQRQTIGWKFNAFVAKRLKEEAIVRIENSPTNA